MGIAESFGIAFFKAQEAAKQPLPTSGAILLSLHSKETPVTLDVANRFADLGFKIIATQGTQEFIASHGIESEFVHKQHEGRPNIVDGIMNGEIQLVINTPSGRQSQFDDSYIRKTAIKYKVTYMTTLAAAAAAAKGVQAYMAGKPTVRSLQSYHADIS